MNDLIDRLHRDLDRIDVAPPPLDVVRDRARRRERRRRAEAGVLGGIVTVLMIAGLWTAAHRSGDQAPSTLPAASTRERLFLSGDGEAWVVDPTSQTAQHLPMPQLPPGDAPFRVVRRADALIAWAYETLLVHPGHDPVTEVLVPDSLIFIPSSFPDRVWVGIADDSRDDAGLASVREVSIDGAVTVPDTNPPGGSWPIAAVGRNLVFQKNDELVVWDPATRDEIERLPGRFPLAWSGDQLAWCDDRCEQLHVTDIAAGSTMTVEPPVGTSGFEAFRGAFSPDGGTLAVAVLLRQEPEGDRQLGLIDIGTGSIRLVKGATVPSPYVFVDWAPSGDTVFIAGGQNAARRQLVKYRVGDPAATVLDVAVGDFYGMAAYEVAP